MKDEWFPYVTKDMKAKHGWDSFYYGNASTPGGGGGGGRGRGAGGTPPPACQTHRRRRRRAPRVGTFEHVAALPQQLRRMRNRFALLSEAYAYATFEDRIKRRTTSWRGARLRAQERRAAEEAVADADKEKVVGTTLATTAESSAAATSRS
jgi:hypothetical protein